MDADNFAEWWGRQGRRVLRTPSSYWYEASPRVFQAFPYHWVIQPSEQEVMDFLCANHAIALRYSTPVESSFGRISYHVIYDRGDYSLEKLDRRSRQNIRTGLKNCCVTQVSLEYLAEAGWELETDTANRQKRRVDTDQEEWRARYRAAAKTLGFEAWGAFVEGRLVASMLTFDMGDCCELISQQCHRDYLSARVNNALAYVVTQTMVNDRRKKLVFYTLESLDAPPTVDEFKFRMGYVAKPLRQRVVFHPEIPPVLISAGYKAVTQLLRWRPFQCSKFPKMNGMFQLYLEGRRPLYAQNWPVCLSPYKASLIQADNRRKFWSCLALQDQVEPVQ